MFSTNSCFLQGYTSSKTGVRKVKLDKGLWVTQWPRQRAVIVLGCNSIIAIHGLDTSAPETWEYRYDKNTGGEVVNWLSDAAMLPAAIPNGCIFTHNWPADFYQDAVDLTLTNHAEGLLLDIRAMREKKGDPNRPIVFIASCFGGLVLAKSLNSAAIEGSNYSFLRHATVGVVFLGTPFQGTPAYRKAQWLVAYGGLMREKTSELVIKDLDQRTGVLNDLVQDFARGARTRNYHLPIHCFFETRMTNLSKKVLPKSLSKYLKVEEFLVDQESACIVGFDRNSLDCAHAMMNKFVPGRDFDRVKSVISKFVEQAGDVFAQRDGGQLSSAEDKECLQDLVLTDPRKEKAKIENRKGGLLKDSVMWILSHRDFLNWRDDDETRLLWIKGDPGKGKTMLLMGIIDELSQKLESTFNSGLLSYFFCLGTDSSLNNATVVLRGLIYLLLVQEMSLISHLRKEYDREGRKMFQNRDGSDAFFPLSKIFTKMLQDPRLARHPKIYLIVDALDECESGLLELLNFIIENVSVKSSRVKWLVSSRNRADIEERFRLSDSGTKLGLEVNSRQVADAVEIYIKHKVLELAKLKQYNITLEEEVRSYIHENAHGTFLWVALVCIQLQDPKTTRRKTLSVLKSIPPGLQEFYRQMMKQMWILNDEEDAELCKRLLASITLAYRPLQLEELPSTVDLPEDFLDDLQSLEELVEQCGAFLIIRKSVVYFVHQSAKDYLIAHADPVIFPAGRSEAHCQIVLRSLHSMDTLRRDIYHLQDLGRPINKVDSVMPDPLNSIRYSCLHWIDHLCEIPSSLYDKAGLYDGGTIDVFLKKHLLHWIEALSVMKSMSIAVFAIRKLEILIAKNPNNAMDLLSIMHDANRFILYNRYIIENAPLQVYASALVFSPTKSRIRKMFQKEILLQIVVSPLVDENWSPCLQTLEGHTDSVWSVAFSYDGRQLASSSSDKTVRIWDTETGVLQHTLEGHTDSVSSVAFSQDGQLASGSADMTIRIWDSKTGVLQRTHEGHTGTVHSVTFSRDGRQLASGSGSDDKTVRIWDAKTGMLQWILEGHTGSVLSVAFSHDGQLASGSVDMTIRIWDSKTGVLQQTLRGHTDTVRSVQFSHDGQLASSSSDRTVRIWDAKTGALQQTLEGHIDSVLSVAFAPNGQLACGSFDKIIQIWDSKTGVLCRTLKGHTSLVWSVMFSHDGQWLASGSVDKTIRIWDAKTGILQQTLIGHTDNAISVMFSHDGRQLASGSRDKTIQIWDAETGVLHKTLIGHTDSVTSVIFSYNASKLVSGSHDMTIRIWDAKTGALQQTLYGHTGWVNSVALSHDGLRLASASVDKTIRIWDTETGALQRILTNHLKWVTSVTFSHDGLRLASGARDDTVRIWDAKTGVLQHTRGEHTAQVRSVAFSHCGRQLASSSVDKTVQIWDAETGKPQRIFRIGRSFESLSFSHDDSYLLTDIGSINLSPLASPKWSGYCLKEDSSWVTWNNRYILWIPPEYRPSSSTIRDNTIAIGCASGKVLLIKFLLNTS